jgi:flagellar protein FlbD
MEMIALHRLNGSEVILNSQHIQTVEKTPDTVILMTDGKRFVVTETVEDVVDKVVDFNSRIVARAMVKPNPPLPV